MARRRAALETSFTLPPALSREVARLAKRQRSTIEEVVLNVVRREVERENAWQRARTYGARKAKAQGIRSDEQIVRIIKAYRRGDRRPVVAKRRRHRKGDRR